MNNKLGFGITSLVLGIVSFLFSTIPLINNICYIFGTFAIIFGIISIIKYHKALAIAGLILGIVSIIITLVFQIFLGNSLEEIFTRIGEQTNKIEIKKTKDILKNDIDIEFGDFIINTDKDGNKHTKLIVTITNKTNSMRSFYLSIEAIDTTGKRIAEDYIEASNLKKGQAKDVEAFVDIDEDMIEKVKSAKYSVITASKY